MEQFGAWSRAEGVQALAAPLIESALTDPLGRWLPREVDQVVAASLRSAFAASMSSAAACSSRIAAAVW